MSHRDGGGSVGIVRLLDVPYFRGVYMRNTLSQGPLRNESAVMNLDDVTGLRTHWVCYKERENKVFYFYGYCNLRPPVELVKYFGSTVKIQYNYVCKQPPNTVSYV